MTLYFPQHKITGQRALPHWSMTGASLWIIDNGGTRLWDIKLESVPDEPDTQSMLAEANLGVSHELPTEAEVDRMALQDEEVTEGRLTPPAYRSVNYHE